MIAQDTPGHPRTAQDTPRTDQDRHIQHTRTRSRGPSPSPPHLCSLRRCVSTTAAEKLLPFHTQASSLLKLTNRS